MCFGGSENAVECVLVMTWHFDGFGIPRSVDGVVLWEDTVGDVRVDLPTYIDDSAICIADPIHAFLRKGSEWWCPVCLKRLQFESGRDRKRSSIPQGRGSGSACAELFQRSWISCVVVAVRWTGRLWRDGQSQQRQHLTTKLLSDCPTSLPSCVWNPPLRQIK